MRLIDADELEARVINFQGRGKKTFLEMLASQPTAYDIDKVVERLERAKGKFKGGTLQEHYYCMGINEAIEIVKGGGSGGQ